MKLSGSLLAAPTLLAAPLVLCGPASAQTTAQPVVPGYNATTGCPSANLTPCFIPQGVVGSGAAGYPPGATPYMNTALNTSNGSSTVTGVFLPGGTFGTSGPTGQYTYICGWKVFTNGGTAQDVDITISTLASAGTGTLNYLLPVPAFSSTTATVIGDTYSPCLRTNALAGAVNISVPAQGTGNTNVTINVWGYTQ